MPSPPPDDDAVVATALPADSQSPPAAPAVAPQPHASHPDIVKRLKRAEGHLRKITAMIEEGRACVEVAQQLAAVEAAVRQAKQVLIRDHIDHCLDDLLPPGPESRAVLAEFKEMSRYL